MSLASFYAAHKSSFVHALSVGGMVVGSVLKKDGNKMLVAGIAAVTAAYHLADSLKSGGLSGLTGASQSFQDMVGDVTGIGKDVLNDAKTAASSVK